LRGGSRHATTGRPPTKLPEPFGNTPEDAYRHPPYQSQKRA